ncbi:hypothetical protein ACFE04_004635 [Oxalis oulophora]
MLSLKKAFIFHILCYLAFACLHCLATNSPDYNFVVKEAPYTKLCSSKNILTVNGQFPGPTVKIIKGDAVLIKVFNGGRYNITIHWHGVKLARNPWSDGPEYITQCPIRPGDYFLYNVSTLNEEGTVWWHAHSDWSRATVHGAIFIYPQRGSSYPFPEPHEEVPIILAEWWKPDVMWVYKNFTRSGGDPIVSDAITINGHPGVLYPCSRDDTFKLVVVEGKTYLFRMVNAAMNIILFFAIANHNLTVVATDAAYTKPYTRDYIVIAPGQSLDVLFHANQNPSQYYYMASRAYSPGTIPFDNTTTSAIVEYRDTYKTTSNNNKPSLFPYLPYYNDTNAAYSFFRGLRSLINDDYPVPKKINTHIRSTLSINTLPCRINGTCLGPNGTRLAASMNNISFVTPTIDILEAYYYHIHGVFGRNFPSRPPYQFNFTGQDFPLSLQLPNRDTQVRVIDYNSTVEVVFQNTNVLAGIDHPMHLHGYSFYVVAIGFGNFNPKKDRSRYNLIDPPLRNTVAVPIGGWAAIRFKAGNPGVWFLHCHIERHLTWGMDTVFIVKNGKTPSSRLLPPPKRMPPC